MNAVLKEKKDSEVVSLLGIVGGGIASEACLANAFLTLGRRTCPKLEDVVADHIGIICRGAKNRHQPLDRKTIEERYPYMEGIRQLPHANLLSKLPDDSYRVALLVGAIMKGDGIIFPESADYHACMEVWRSLFFPVLKAIN